MYFIASYSFREMTPGLGIQMRKKNYNYVFILAGTNDIGEGTAPARSIANIELLIACCLSKSDSIKVGLILGNLHVF